MTAGVRKNNLLEPALRKNYFPKPVPILALAPAFPSPHFPFLYSTDLSRTSKHVFLLLKNNRSRRKNHIFSGAEVIKNFSPKLQSPGSIKIICRSWSQLQALAPVLQPSPFLFHYPTDQSSQPPYNLPLKIKSAGAKTIFLVEPEPSKIIAAARVGAW